MTRIIEACKTASKKVFVPIVDRVISYTVSKKLSVFVIATIFLYLDRITGDQWVTIATIYIGFQTAVDVTKEIRNPYRNNNDNSEYR